MVKKRTRGVRVTPSSGNVFADMGLPEPEEELAKAKLATHIAVAIRKRHLTQAQAAALMGVDQPKVSAMVNGRLDNFSSERLMRLLTRLGWDVEISVRATRSGTGKPGQIRVIEAAVA
ncbi:MAG: helix-turn-helix transcriptional regulator [Reyranellaceae bacterium]